MPPPDVVFLSPYCFFLLTLVLIKYTQYLKLPLLHLPPLFFFSSQKGLKIGFCLTYGNWSIALESSHVRGSIISWLMVSHCGNFSDILMPSLGPQIHFISLYSSGFLLWYRHTTLGMRSLYFCLPLKSSAQNFWVPVLCLVRFCNFSKVESASRTKLWTSAICF